jgi:hypothetical protein
MKPSFFAPLLAFLLGTPAAARDGMPIENGRFVGGPSTVITLSDDQAQKLRDRESDGSFKELALSEAQRVALQRSAGAAPVMLLVYNTRKGENDCCCEARNLGLWFSAYQLEVPHRYLDAEGALPTVPENERPRLGIALIAALLVVASGIVIASRVANREPR